jgi:hypothetical protein
MQTPERQQTEPDEISAARLQSDERLRFKILRAVYEAASYDAAAEVNASRFAPALSVPLERVFAVVEFLSREGYLAYRGAGPRVSLTQRGIDYVEAESGRRGTLRD